MSLLRAEKLVKVFGKGRAEFRAVGGIDFEIEQGEIALVMGPSGCGKTTLLFMLGGLLRPTSGRVFVRGKDISALPERMLSQVRLRNFGFIFQDFNLLSSLTARENVELAMNLAGRNGRNSKQDSWRLLKELNLGKRADNYPETLSGGEMQRVCIARALANLPSLILADEPTANLDSASGRGVVSMLRELAKTKQRAVVIVSHDTRIMDIADRVLLMEDGVMQTTGVGG